MSPDPLLIRLVYVSRNRIEGPPRAVSDEIRAMLGKSRAWNGAHGVTGALMFNSGRFAQVLEGPAEHVELLYAKIAADPRHDQVQIIAREALASRAFAEWSMAYVGPDGMPDIPLSPTSAPGDAAQRVLAQLRAEIRKFAESANVEGEDI